MPTLLNYILNLNSGTPHMLAVSWILVAPPLAKHCILDLSLRLFGVSITNPRQSQRHHRDQCCAEANLAAAHHQIAQLQSQLRQEQTRAAQVTHLKAQATQLRTQLQQQLLAAEEQATAAAALSGGFDQERASWQEERSSLLTRAKV